MTSAPEDGLLFDIEAPPPVALADRFGVPPFSVWDKRGGDWQNRKRRWLSLGIKSELGRDEGLTFATTNEFMQNEMEKYGGTTSVFDPVVCELAYRWFSNPGDTVLDPFAGGSVRGVVAGVLGRDYVGIDLREEQVLANKAQAHIALAADGIAPDWLVGDATRSDEVLVGSGMPKHYDMVLTCPPYAYLERYSDDPRDLSTMSYAQFTHAHRTAIFRAVEQLREDRFIVWVISDVRDDRTGAYLGLVGDTIEAFHVAGAHLYNDIILVEPVGTGRLRGANLFNRTRKLVRMHQHVLVFVKGDGKRAARRLDPVDPRMLVDTTPEGEQDGIDNDA